MKKNIRNHKTSISAIIPTYDAKDYLSLAIESALNHSVLDNTVIIVVVDGTMEYLAPVLNSFNSSKIKIIDLETNRGLSMAINWGVLASNSDYVLVTNDDNVFPPDWDHEILKNMNSKTVFSPNQIEPQPSMFKQFVIKNLGLNTEEFDMEKFVEFHNNIRSDLVEFTGSTLPFVISRHMFITMNGWDILFPSPYVVDWDFFKRCEILGMDMKRCYNAQFYHFSGLSSSNDRNKQEQKSLDYYIYKWIDSPTHNPETNSKN